MTDRINAVTVILDRDVRIDDAEDGILTAIRMIKGVQSVAPHVTEHLSEFIVESKLKEKLRDAMWEVLK